METGGNAKELFLSGMEDSINQILGKNVAKTVYYHLEKNYSLKLEDIPEKPEVFSEAIKNIFGQEGANVIEAFLIKELFTRFELVLQKKEDYKFSDYVYELLHKGALKNKKTSDI